MKPQQFSHTQVPKGSTCPGVHALVLQLLTQNVPTEGAKSLLDIPCGKAEFLSVLHQLFPGWTLHGADLFTAPKSEGYSFHQVDAAKGFSISSHPAFDYVTCISGVMEFDNTLNFFKDCNRHLHDRGILFISNDNHGSVYDRLSYLFLGAFRRPYRIFVAPGQTTWRVITINNLCRILLDSGFEVVDVHYVSTSFKDMFLGILFGPLLYTIQRVYRFLDKATRRSAVSQHLQRKLYPFKSYFCRHYVLVCKKA